MGQSDFYRGVETAQRALRGAAGAGAAARAEVVHAALQPAFDGTDEAPRRACRRGCDACCHLPVGIAYGEALRLAAAVAAVPGLPQRLAAAAAATAGLPWRELAGLACPLLDGGACLVHAARPLPCRALASRDAAACAAGLAGRGDVPVDDAAFLLGLGAASALAAAEVPAGTRELRSALAAVLRAGDPPAREAAFAAARPAGEDRAPG